MKNGNEKLAIYQRAYMDLCCGVRKPTNNNMLDKFYMQYGSQLKSPLISLNMLSYFDRNLAFKYIQATHNLFVRDTKRASTDEIKNNQNELFALGVALSDLFFAFNTKSDDTEFALYTSSLSMLKYLDKIGMLTSSRGTGSVSIAEFYDNYKVDAEVDAKGKFIHPCTGLTNFIKQNKDKKKVNMKVIRLDPVSYNGVIKFKPVDAVGFSLDKMIIYPYSSISEVYRYIRDMSSRYILEITEKGDKVYVTTNANILSSVYSKDRVELLLKRSSSLIGVLTKEFYMPELGKSTASFGLHNIKLENIDSIRLLSTIAETGLGDKIGEVNLDTTDLPYFLRHTNLLNESNLDVLLQVYGNYKGCDWNISEIKKADTEHYNNIKNKVLTQGYYNELWECIRRTPQLAILKQGYEQYINNKQRQYVPVPREKWNYEDLKELSNNNLLKIVSKRVGSSSSKAGATVKLRTSIVTNSHKVLAKYLGDDFIQNYESVGVRLRVINNKLVSKEITTDEQLRQAIIEYHLEDRISVDTLTMGNAGVVLGDVYNRVKSKQKGQGFDNFTGRSPFGLTTAQGGKFNTYNINIPIKEIQEVYIIKEV